MLEEASSLVDYTALLLEKTGIVDVLEMFLNFFELSTGNVCIIVLSICLKIGEYVLVSLTTSM